MVLAAAAAVLVHLVLAETAALVAVAVAAHLDRIQIVMAALAAEVVALVPQDRALVEGAPAALLFTGRRVSNVTLRLGRERSNS